MITVRRAALADIAAMSAVLTASITELCTPDHRDDAAVIAGWTRNKSHDGVAKMLGNPHLRMFVAERDSAVAAVGAVTAGGEVALNYVSPAHRFAGVSRALLIRLEESLREAGIVEATLTSTETAHRFYRSAGWTDDGAVHAEGATPGYPMRKRL